VTDAASQDQHKQRMEELFATLWNDADLGPKVRAKAKEKWSDITLPEDQVAGPLNELRSQNETLAKQLKEMQERQEARDKEEADRKAIQTMTEGIDRAVREFNLTDDGRAKMMERMKGTGNYGDPEAAAAWVAHQTPPQDIKGPTFGAQHMNLFGSAEPDEKYRQLHTNPEKYMDAELNEFLKNPDKYVAETLGTAA
jgi:hypothetical protein